MAEDLTKRAASGYLQDTAASSSSFSLSRQASPKPKTVRVSATPPSIFFSLSISLETRQAQISPRVRPFLSYLSLATSIPIEGRTKRNIIRHYDASN